MKLRSTCVPERWEEKKYGEGLEQLKAYSIICERWWSSVIAGACVASSSNGFLVFSDDMTEERCSWKNSEVYRDILSAQIQPNATKLIGRRFIVQLDNDPKYTAKATQEFLKAKQWNILQWPSQSSDFNPIEYAFHLLKTKLEAERPTNKQQLNNWSQLQGLAKHHKRGNPVFGDVREFQS